MNGFDNIVGYDSVKEELRQICDMIHNIALYEELGAKMSKGLLLYGSPGVGKSLMARSFVTESERKSYIIRRNKPGGDFINEIRNVFSEAAENAPSIVFLDDMDKFVVEDDSREEYVTLQACIDQVMLTDVYVIATANDISDLPDSLLRAGRFDRKIYIDIPRGEDAEQIIRHYLTSKSVVCDVNTCDVAKMLHGKSCAELETILNEAAIYAGFERCEKITIDHIVRAVLCNVYGVSNFCYKIENALLEKVAYHEAGHVVVSELVNPGGIGLASLHKKGWGDYAGFVTRCSDLIKPDHNILISLAGKASVELNYGFADTAASRDIEDAVEQIADNVMKNGSCGISGLEVFNAFTARSLTLHSRQEGMIHSELERFYMQTKEILIKNRSFLDAVAEALLEKDTLLHSDIQAIKKTCCITAVAS